MKQRIENRENQGNQKLFLWKDQQNDKPLAKWTKKERRHKLLKSNKNEDISIDSTEIKRAGRELWTTICQ